MDLVDDHAAERQARLDELAMEVRCLGYRLALRPADDEEAGPLVGQQRVHLPRPLAEAADHAAERLEELGEIVEEVDAGDPTQHGEHHRGPAADDPGREPGGAHEYPKRPALDELDEAPGGVEEVEGVSTRRRIEDQEVVA